MAANGDVTRTVPQQAWAWLDGAQNLRQRQHAISAQEEVARREALLGQAAPFDRGRIRSCGGWSAGAWLQVAPTQDLFTFDDSAFTTATRFRLGKDVGVPTVACKHVYAKLCGSQDTCSKEVDAFIASPVLLEASKSFGIIASVTSSTPCLWLQGTRR